MKTEDTPASLALMAAGSLPRLPALAYPSFSRRLRLSVELAILFLGAPLAMVHLLEAYRVPLVLLLPPVLVAFIVYLFWDPTFSLRREFVRGFSLAALVSIVITFLVVGGVVSVWMWSYQPTDFLAFPTYRPALWAIVMIFYPLFSALPQELLYRTFFFHRYGPLFGDRRWFLVAVNGALFGFAHVMFDSIVSIALSGALGLLLAYRYSQTRSIWAAWVEHSLYGQLVFTVGLGRYFFYGVSPF